MTLQILEPTQAPIFTAADLVMEAITNENTKRAYGMSIQDFQDWWIGTGQVKLTKHAVNQYKQFMLANNIGNHSINKRLAAIRKLAMEAADNNLLDYRTAEAIGRVENISLKGESTRNWLTKEDAQAVIDAPDTDTIIGVRDRAMLSVLLGCGLRREELTNMKWEDIQQREARWVVVVPNGKGNKSRIVPMASWTKHALDKWEAIFGWGQSEYVFIPMNKGGDVIGDQISTDTVYRVVRKYTEEIGVEGISPHDLRRTYAKLARKGGAYLEQIKLSLGHEKIETTMKYIGEEQDFSVAPCDVLGLGV